MKMPFSTDVITSADELYGRKELIESLQISAKMNINVQLIGTRRFGKTCIFRSMCNVLSKEDSPCYPIYLDFKCVSSAVSGTSDVYKYIVSVIVCNLFQSCILDNDELTFNETINIKPHKTWSHVFGQLSSLGPSDALGLFQEFIPWIADLLGKPILLMIDEYEYLIKYSLNCPDDFFAIRNLATETLTDTGQRILVFWVAGAETWKHIGEVTGSGWGNTMHSPTYVDPLEKEDFLKMWNDEVQNVESEAKRSLLMSKAEFAWEKSGGIPFYGKLIGTEFLVKKNAVVDYTLLQTFFDEILKGNMSKDEKQILKSLSTLARRFQETPALKSLINKGLVKYDDKLKRHQITIGFLSDYLKTLDFITVTKMPQTFKIVDEIRKLIENINSQRPHDMIFRPINEEVSLAIGMRSLVCDENTMLTFAAATYKMYLERSAGKTVFADGSERIVYGKKLPFGFKKSYDPVKPESGKFARAVDRLRQTYIHLFDNNRPINSQMDETEMLDFFINKSILPLRPAEFAELQMGVLNKFIIELENMRESICGQHW